MEKQSCRICLEEDKTFISPCLCKGTMKYVHPVCLNQWRKHSLHPLSCENCHFKYKIQYYTIPFLYTLFILTLSILFYLLLLHGCYTLGENLYPFIDSANDQIEKTIGLSSRRDYFKSTRRGN